MYTAVTRIKNKPYKFFLFKHGRDGKEKKTFIQQQHSHIQI